MTRRSHYSTPAIIYIYYIQILKKLYLDAEEEPPLKGGRLELKKELSIQLLREGSTSVWCLCISKILLSIPHLFMLLTNTIHLIHIYLGFL